jgi:hypothetical protein
MNQEAKAVTTAKRIVNPAGGQTPFQGKLDVLDVGERIANEKGRLWIAT